VNGTRIAPGGTVGGIEEFEDGIGCEKLLARRTASKPDLVASNLVKQVFLKLDGESESEGGRVRLIKRCQNP
jgi:hypothetical protein